MCVLGALLGASRYEGFFLIGLVCLAFLVRRQLLRAVSIGVAALVPVAAFGAISVANGSYFLPNPLMVKAVGETTSTLSALLKPFGSEDLAFLQNNRAMPILARARRCSARSRTGVRDAASGGRRSCFRCCSPR